MKIIAFIFSLLLFLPLRGESLTCSVCGKNIRSGSYYQTEDQRIICSKRCLDSLKPVCSVCGGRIEGRFLKDERQNIFCSEACYDTTLPVCSVCGKRVRRGYRQDQSGRIFCSEKCAATTLPVCRCCGKHAASGAKMHDGSFLCNACLALPQCASCKKPIRAQIHSLDDGRRICSNCRQKGIFTQEDALREFENVRQQLKEQLGLHAPGRIIFQLVDLNRLKDFAESGGGENELGICHHRVTAVTRGEKELRREYRREICILYGLQPAHFRAVAAHELAHDWFNMNIEGKLAPEIMEGWAELVSWHYCRAMGYREEQKLIENNGAELYRRGFLKMKKRLFLPVDPQKIRGFFKSMNPEPLL